MKQYVLDASVGVKWFFAETNSQKAFILFERFEQKAVKLIVPELFFVEFASAACSKVKAKEASFDQAVKALDDLLESDLTRYPDEELTDVALENAFRFNISVYDGLYLALAEIYCASLVTADKTLLKACKRFDFLLPLEEIS